MTITQETANLVETLAHAASQIGSTAASAKINQLIVDLLPGTNESAETIAEALRQDNIALTAELDGTQKSAMIMAENLELLRTRMVDIYHLAIQPVTDDGEAVISQIIALTEPAAVPVEA